MATVTSTLSEDIDATQNYVPVASTSGFATGVNATIESTNEVVSFNDLSENLFRYSQDFTNAVYTKTATVTANATTAPDGTNTGTRVTFSGAFQRVQQSATTVSGTQYTISLFAKNDSNTNAISVHTNNSPFINIGSFTPGADWLRYSFTFTATITGTTDISIVQDRNSSGFGSIFIWGAQLEQATSTSTYLPTTTSALVGLTGVTRGVNGTTAQAASSGASISQTPSLGSLNMPVRLKGLSISPDGTGAGRLTLCDNNGDTLCDIDIPDGKIYTLFLPEEGIVFPNGVFVSNTINVTGYTVFTSKYSGPNLT